jgi:class 3 adenylate cyclase
MRLPNSVHTSRPWRIHEFTRDFRLEDVWELPGVGGPDAFPRLAMLLCGNAARGAVLYHLGEDHPQRALYAALRLQDEMRRYSAKLRTVGNQPIEARVGVNTGEVVVRSIATGEGHVEYTPIGHSTSLAARMQALAPTGSIAATDTTTPGAEGAARARQNDRVHLFVDREVKPDRAQLAPLLDGSHEATPRGCARPGRLVSDDPAASLRLARPRL